MKALQEVWICKLAASREKKSVGVRRRWRGNLLFLIKRNDCFNKNKSDHTHTHNTSLEITKIDFLTCAQPNSHIQAWHRMQMADHFSFLIMQDSGGNRWIQMKCESSLAYCIFGEMKQTRQGRGAVKNNQCDIEGSFVRMFKYFKPFDLASSLTQYG